MTTEDLERLWRLLDEFGGDREYWAQYVEPHGEAWGAVVEAKRQVEIALIDAGQEDLVDRLHQE
jgi:hypothetical protein